MKLKKKHNSALILFCMLEGVLITIGVSASYVTLFSFLLGVLWCCLKTNIMDSFSLMFFLTSYSVVFKMSDTGTALLVYLQFLVIGKCFFIENRNRVLTKSFFFSWMLFFMYAIIGGIDNIQLLAKHICIPLFLFFAVRYENEDSLLDCVETYSLGVITSSIVGVFKENIPNMVSYVNDKTTRLSAEVLQTRFSGIRGDSNYYSVNLILCMALVLYLHIKGRISTTKAIGVYLLMAVFGAMGGSKTFIALLVIVILFLIIESIKSQHYFFATACICGVIVGLFLILNGTISIFNLVIERLISAQNAVELTTERSMIWGEYLKEFWNKPLKFIIGNGLSRGFSLERYPHNTYIDFLDIYGVIGTSLFVITCKNALHRINNKRIILRYIPFIILSLMYFTLSMLHYSDFVYQITLASLVIIDGGCNQKNIAMK